MSMEMIVQITIKKIYYYLGIVYNKCMMVDKKKPNQQNPEPCRNYKNELSLLPEEKANEIVGKSLKIYVDMRLSSYQYKNASMLHLFLIVIKYCLNCLDT
ncbi:hypothetical protein QTP88_007115 [Uroleucon formosanum]